MNIPLRYREPMLKISSVQALIVYWVGISLIHSVNKAFPNWLPQVPGLSCLCTYIHSFISYYSYSPRFHLFFLFSLIHCPCHLFTWRFPPIQRCLSLIQMNNMIISWSFTFPLFIRSKTYSYRAPKSHLVLKILTRMEWLFLQGLFSLVTNLLRKLLYT